MSDGFGPYSVSAAQVAGLGGALFQELVNRLLDSEVARASLSGAVLRTTSRVNRGDRGVDAALYSATETEWIPAGNSAWQFKAGDLSPAECARELENATRAHEILQQGGKYRLVLGKSLEDHLVEDRQRELVKKAQEIGFDTSGDNFSIIAGDRLSAWVERYPPLAVSQILGGIGHAGIAFDKWQLSDMHQFIWAPSQSRDDLAASIIGFLEDPKRLAFRVEGVSGLGKTRSVLEALRGSQYEPLVLYIADAHDINSAVLDQLIQQNRAAVVVIDECSRTRHNTFAQQLRQGASVKIITIGESEARIPHATLIQLAPLPDDAIDNALTQNRPQLWPEARRVVIANCAGNVRWALFIAEQVIQSSALSAESFIDAEILRGIVGDVLASDTDFLALSALALLTRYGVEREVALELEQIAGGLGLPLDQLLAANRKLERLGLVTKHGRYRSVSPQPLALLLAGRAWDELGEVIINSLLPSMDDSMVERLLTRAADLGSTGPAADALRKILSADGSFRSLRSIAEENVSKLLIPLAIVSPAEAVQHLGELIGEATDAELRDLKSIRRDLVWALEKLVWHSATFETAADAILRLAVAENETWNNNATGTWIGLFGAILPTTAAEPAARIAYLNRVALADNPAVRLLAVRAAAQALDVRGGIVMVSGELQGGVIVEPRGRPATYDDLWAYMRSVITILQRLTSDPDGAVRRGAEDALISVIHPYLENEAVRDSLFEALVGVSKEGLRRVRTEVQHLYALFARVETPEFMAATDSSPDVAGRRTGLDLLNSRLPVATAVDELAALSFAQRWEWTAGELQNSILRTAQSLPSQVARESIFELLSSETPPDASFELGVALYSVDASDETLASLVDIADSGHPAALTGFLHASVAAGNVDVFDDFLDSDLAKTMSPATQLTITVRGPQSDAGWSRLIELMSMLTVHEGASGMFGWHADVEEIRIVALLDEWLPKIDSQQDYNFAVDAVSAMLHQRKLASIEVEDRVVQLVETRSKFPQVGRESWDWVQLARRALLVDSQGLLERLLRQIDEGAIHAWDGSEEQKLLRDAIQAVGAPSLDHVMHRVQAGSWRLQMDLRGWLTDAYASGDVVAWVGDDVGRARVVASMTAVGDGMPSDTVRFLLDRFGTDESVSSALYGNFVSGSWIGSMSDRLSKQIDQLDSWVGERDVPTGTKSWARSVLSQLRRQRERALEEEAEGRE